MEHMYWFYDDKSKRVAVADAFDPSHKRQRPTGEGQKTFDHDREGGTHHFSMTSTYTVQPEAHTIHRPHDVKMLPVSNISLSMSNPFFKTHFAGYTGQINLARATTAKQQLSIGGVPPVTAAHPSTTPPAGSIAGFSEQWTNATGQTQQLVSTGSGIIPVKADAHPTFPWPAEFTELRNNNDAKASRSPAQLTIFYAGTVNVYDDISPEKAQAIMLIAKNLSSSTGVSVNPVARVDTPKIVNSPRPVTVATRIRSAAPLAHKASLARFLERRMERSKQAISRPS